MGTARSRATAFTTGRVLRVNVVTSSVSLIPERSLPSGIDTSMVLPVVRSVAWSLPHTTGRAPARTSEYDLTRCSLTMTRTPRSRARVYRALLQAPISDVEAARVERALTTGLVLGSERFKDHL